MRSIDDWVYRHFTDVLPYGGGTDLRVNCPFCGMEDTGHHLHISLSKQVCHCFRCDYSSTWAGLIADCTGVDIRSAMEEISSEGITPLYILRRMENMPEHIRNQRLEGRFPATDLPENFMTIAEAYRTEYRLYSDMARQYVYGRLDRRLNGQALEILCHRWGIWASAEGYGKLVLPVERGWWQERVILKNRNGAKYVSCHSPKEDRLYNYPALKQERVYIAEGIISAAALGEQAIALCGKKATPEQLKRLIRAPVKEYTVCLDSDALANALWLAGKLFHGGKKVVLRKYIEGDPASSDEYEESEYTTWTSVEMALNPHQG